MQLHHRIIHHLRKQKERVIAHVNKHHKKYLFWAGMAFGVTALKVMAILGLFVGIDMVVWRSQAANQEAQVYQELAIFNMIDGFAHKKYNEISIKNDPMTTELDKIFSALDWTYHSSENLNEKYRTAKKLVAFLVQRDGIIKNLGYTTSGDDQQFNEMVYEFYQIK